MGTAFFIIQYLCVCYTGTKQILYYTYLTKDEDVKQDVCDVSKGQDSHINNTGNLLNIYLNSLLKYKDDSSL